MTKRLLMQNIRDIRQAGEGPVAYEDELLPRYGGLCAVPAIDSSGFTKPMNRHGIIHALDTSFSKTGYRDSSPGVIWIQL